MQITVSGKQVELSESLKNRVTKHLNAIAQKYFKNAPDARVVFSRARNFFTCDINVRIGNGVFLRGEGESKDANTAFDDAAENIAKRLRRHHNRIKNYDHLVEEGKQGADNAREYVLNVNSTAFSESDEITVERKEGVIIAEINEPLYRLSVSDAVMMLDLADLPIVMFTNNQSGRINTVYRRADGNIGWLDPVA